MELKMSWKHICKALGSLYEKLEFTLFANWFNPLATLYLNFRSFSLCQAIKFPVYVYGTPRFCSLGGKMRCEGKIKKGMITINKSQFACPSNTTVQTEIANRGLIIFRGNAIIGTGNKIVVETHGILDLGKYIKITDFCNISVYTQVIIGEYSRIVHRCQIMDSNFHYVADFNKKIVPYLAHPIKIGKYCWICNSSSVAGGATIPDYTIIASNSLANKKHFDLPPMSMIGGIPAKYIISGIRRVENAGLNNQLETYFGTHPEALSFELPSDSDPSLCNSEND